ncbi:Membrane protein involved in the export of O-antigen and teichoic acid [Pelosinus fermentans]|uniref:lipopolysaccharide biosynthesis protein n=1 Tax=Pelosinus fermentans TaxID=365349 RepID=UPI0002685D9D|nr:oligosaccharide flippase family protein [Pelosinus fermentans]OAM92790.1 polysaccharide biosynthesis protein [Pelosinus fermentans DSM 17108]SDQ56942.1 Membrane protein involved in the export of O-antigen and teichoic acid [Pelosinus fermentans]
MFKKLFSSSLFRSMGVYTTSNFINMAIPFFLMPIMTRYMSPEDYGITAMFQVITGFLAPFIGLGMQDAINRKYFDRDRIDLPKYIANCLMIVAITAVIASFTLYFFSNQISKIAFFPQEWLWGTWVVAIGQFLVSLVLGLWQVQFKSILYSIYQVVMTLANMVLSLWFIVGLDLKWQGRLEAQILVVVVFGLLGLFILYRQGWMNFTFDYGYAKDALKFGLPLVPHALGGIIMTMTDRIFITTMVGITDTGLYSVGAQIGMVIALIEGAFGTAWGPWLFERLKRDDTDKTKSTIVKMTYLYFIGLFILTIGLSMIAPWFLSFFIGEKFVGAGKFVFWIALGNAFGGMFRIVALYIVYVEKTHILATITFVSAGLYTISNYLFISWHGSLGAAQSFAFIKFVFLVLTWILSNRVFQMPWMILKK